MAKKLKNKMPSKDNFQASLSIKTDEMRDAIVKDFMRDAVVKDDEMRDAVVKDDEMRDAIVKDFMRDAVVKDLMRDAVVKDDFASKVSVGGKVKVGNVSVKGKVK